MWTQDDIPDLSGKTAVVTGANGGLGFETAKGLAAKGAHVVMAARNQLKAQKAKDEILAAHPDASLEICELDLSSQASTKEAAAKISEAHPQIHILVNNAGVMATPETKTVDGYEQQLGVNHLGHWTFTAGLLPSILRAEKARVVAVSSVARFQGSPIDPDNPHLEGKYDAWGAYGQSKLANYHFALGLQNQFEDAGADAASLVAHPGLSNSDLQATTVEAGGGGWIGSISHKMAEVVGMPIERGARPQLRAATDRRAKGGELYGPLFGSNGPAVKRPVLNNKKDAIDTLWQVSERETGVPIDVAAINQQL